MAARIDVGGTGHRLRSLNPAQRTHIFCTDTWVAIVCGVEIGVTRLGENYKVYTEIILLRFHIIILYNLMIPRKTPLINSNPLQSNDPIENPICIANIIAYVN